MTTSAGTTATIREATRQDLEAIERLLVDSSLPTEGVADIIAAHSEDFFVAEANGDRAIVGVGGLEVCDGDALLRSVVVRPEWRTHGLGQELVRRIVCHAESRGIRALYLLTTTAEHYFPRFGFERIERGAVPSEIAQTLEFKSACPETATAMRKALG